MAKFLNSRYTAIFLITLLTLIPSGKALRAGIVLCISGNGHVALEFEHNGHVPSSESPDSASAKSKSIFGITPQHGTVDQCLDTPISFNLLRLSVASVQPIPFKIVTIAYGMSTSPASSYPNVLYLAGNQHLPSFQTSTSLSLHTTVLLI